MSVVTLNNNDIADILKDAIKQSTGSEAVDSLDLSGIVDLGNDESIIGSREQFTKALINVVTRNWFTDSKYRTQYKDPFFQDSDKFGAIVQAISIEVPEVQEASNWKDFGPDTQGGQTATVGVYTIHLPQITTNYYGKSVSWSIPITITGSQWDTAFDSESNIREFVGYILMCVDNAIIIHLEDLDNANRNNFMGEKIAYAASQGATGVHKVNLVEMYVKEMGDPTADFSVEDYLSDVNATRHGSEKIRLFKKYFGKMSTKYNVGGKMRFTPDERIVLQVLSFFEERLATVALSDTYQKDTVELPGFQSIPYWQGSGVDEDDFDEISKIEIKTASGDTVEQSGIVAFLCDKWAILHTLKEKRIGVQKFDIENLTLYEYQFRDMYMNNLTMNAIVFTLEDYTAPTP